MENYILLKTVRDKQGNKRLFDVIATEESIIISIKGKGMKEAAHINIGEILYPYLNEKCISLVKNLFRIIYLRSIHYKSKVS